jgi:hypothetical protein
MAAIDQTTGRDWLFGHPCAKIWGHNSDDGLDQG